VRVEHRLLCVLLAAPALLASARAAADIYAWTDARGQTVISNVQPSRSERVRNLRLVAKESPPSAQAADPAKRAATRTEQALLDRIAGLERQLQAAQSAPLPQALAPAPYDYYPAPPPPPVYDTGDYPAYYYPSAAYAPVYYYPYAPAYFVARPRVFAPRPAFVHPRGGFVRGGFVRGASMHRGRR